jgi:hypothetical protein
MLTESFMSSGALAQQSVPPATNQRDGDWYAVEVIVFRPTTSLAGGNELMPPDPVPPSLENALAPGAAAANAGPRKSTADYARPLSRQDYKLAGIWKKLSRSGRYKPLLHSGWIQRRVPDRQAQKISITPLVKAPAPAAQTMYSDGALTASPAETGTSGDSHEGEEAGARIAPADKPAFGTVTLAHAGRHLHLAVDVAWRAPDTAAVKTWQAPSETAAPSTSSRPRSVNFNRMGPFPAHQTGPKIVVLRATRTIRPGALNYFDNPLFGVIIQVRKIKPPTAASGGNGKAGLHQRH